MSTFNKFELRYKYDSKGNKIFVSVEEYVEYHVDGSDYERGQLETVEARAENTGKILARLIGVLYKTKKISRKEVEFIVEEKT